MKRTFTLVLAALALVSLAVLFTECGGNNINLADGLWIGEDRIEPMGDRFEIKGDRIWTADRARNIEYARLVQTEAQITLAMPGIQTERIHWSIERVNKDEVLLNGIRFVRQT